MSTGYGMRERFAVLVEAHAEEREAYAAEIACLAGLTVEQARGLVRGEACLRLSRQVAAFFADEGERDLARRFEALARRVEDAERLDEWRFHGACRAVEDAVGELARRWAAPAPPAEPTA
jgi:hypothetical protein